MPTGVRVFVHYLEDGLMSSRRKSVVLRFMMLAWAGLLLSACGLVTDPGRFASISRDLSVNMRRWHDQGYSSYDYVVSNQCFCVLGGVPVRVSVRDAQVVSVVYVSTGLPLESNLVSSYGDVERLFRLIDDAIAAHAASIRATYDPVLGYPADVFIDYARNVADEESGFRVTSFTPVAR